MDELAREFLRAYREDKTPTADARAHAWRRLAAAKSGPRAIVIIPAIVLALAAAAIVLTLARPSIVASLGEDTPASAPYATPPDEETEVVTVRSTEAPRLEPKKPIAAPIVREEPPPIPEPAPPPRPPKRVDTPRPEPSALSDELALLRPAQAALRAGDPTKALRLYERHAKRFPDSALAEERAAGRVLALCALGRTDAAAGRRSFERTYPGSPLLARVAGACTASE